MPIPLSPSQRETSTCVMRLHQGTDSGWNHWEKRVDKKQTHTPLNVGQLFWIYFLHGFDMIQYKYWQYKRKGHLNYYFRHSFLRFSMLHWVSSGSFKDNTLRLSMMVRSSRFYSHQNFQVDSKNAVCFFLRAVYFKKAEGYSKQDVYHLFQEVLCIQHHFCLQERLGLLHEMLWSPPEDTEMEHST